MSGLGSASADLVQIAPRALLTGGVVWMIIRSLDSMPPRVTALVISLPMVIGAGFLALAATESAAFVERAGRMAIQAMPGVIAFVTVALRIFSRVGPAGLLAGGLSAWAASAVVLTLPATPLPVPMGLALGVLAMGLSHLLVPIRAGFMPMQPATAAARVRRKVWPVAVQAAVLVVVLSIFSHQLAPRFSAIISTMPVASLLVALDLKRSSSPVWEGTLQSVRIGLPCLYCYLVALVMLLPHVGASAAAWLAFAPSMALSGLIVWARLKLTF